MYKQTIISKNSRQYLEDILIQIKNELRDNQSFNNLLMYLRDFRRTEKEEENLIKKESDNRNLSNQLNRAVNKTIEDTKEQAQNANKKIAKCKDDIETMLFDNALKIRYVDQWENARIEQGLMICDKNENEQQEIIDQYKNEIEKEIRINIEIENYITENQKDIEESIENWMQRYDTELEEKVMQIQTLKDKKEEQEIKYKQMLLDYEVHGKEIAEFLIFKENKRIEEETEALRNAAATKIQAWWRGLMVRLKLGPFNPNPKKKKKKDKKGKKDKGKKKK